MDLGDMYTGSKRQSAEEQGDIVKKSSIVFKYHKEDYSCVAAVPGARTPIVKLHHSWTKLDCDISFRHGLGVENTKFLRYMTKYFQGTIIRVVDFRFCIQLQPILQPLILLLKKWSDCCEIKEYITSYALAIMAIFYLQVNGYLYSVKTIRQYNVQKAKVIDGKLILE